MTEDEALLQAWREGDTKAGDTLLGRHFDALYLFFRSKLDGPIDDLIQATLLACVESRDGFRGEASFRVFLLGIARNLLLKHLRRNYRQAKVFAPDRTSVHEVVPDPNTGASMRLAKGRDRALLLAGLRRLPIDLQIALELYYWEGMGLAQIAVIQQVPAGTVKSRLARARATLEREMNALADSKEAVAQTLADLELWARDLQREKS